MASPFFHGVDFDGDGNFLDVGEDVALSLRVAAGLACLRGMTQLVAFSPPAIGDIAFVLENNDGAFSDKRRSGKLTRLSTVAASSGSLELEGGGDVLLEGGSDSLLLEGVAGRDIWTGITEKHEFSVPFGDRVLQITGLSLLKRLNEKVISTPVYTNISISDAVEVVLDAAGWPDDERIINASTHTLDVFFVDKANAYDVLLALMNTDGPAARFYDDPSGFFVWESNETRSTQARSITSQETFSDTDGTILSETYDENEKSVLLACKMTQKTRTAQPMSEIWNYGTERLTLTANEVRTFIIRPSDVVINAQVPSAAKSNTTYFLKASAPLTSGDYALRFRGETTATLAWNDNDAAIQTQLEGLASIGASNVLAAGNLDDGLVVTLIGALGGQEITDLIEAVNVNLNPVSVHAELNISEVQQGNGTLVEIQRIAPSGLLVSGKYTIFVDDGINAGTTSSLNYNDSVATIRGAIQAISGFGSTAAFGSPFDTSLSGVQVNFVQSVPMPLMTITPDPVDPPMTTQPGATIAVTQSDRGGKADYVVVAGGLVDKSLSANSGASLKLTLEAGDDGATLEAGWRMRGQLFPVTTSIDVQYPDPFTGPDGKVSAPNVIGEISLANARTLMQAWVDYWNTPRAIVVTHKLVDCRDVMALDAMLQREISDRVTCQIDFLGINGDFFVEWVRRIIQWPIMISEYGCEVAR